MPMAAAAVSRPHNAPHHRGKPVLEVMQLWSVAIRPALHGATIVAPTSYTATLPVWFNALRQCDARDTDGGQRSSSKTQRVGDPVKSLCSMEKTRCGRTPIVAFFAGLRKSRSTPLWYLAFIRSTTRCSTDESVANRAVPPMMTGSDASSVVTQQRGSARRFLTFRDSAAEVNHSVLSSHMPHTGMVCGRPSGQVLTTQ